MAEQIAANVAQSAIKSLISQAWIEVQYLFDYDDNIEKLRKKVEELKVKKDVIQLSIDEAHRNAERIGPDVLEWLKKVETIEEQANVVLKGTSSSEWGCLCPKLHSCYKLSKQASKKTREVIEIKDAGNFSRIGYQAQPGQLPFTSTPELDGLESRMRIQNDVIKALKDDSITVIGICGMAGIGKTTLVEQIADKVRSMNLFDEVAMAVVSKDLVVAKIQDELAENLELKIEKNTDRARADRLYARLMSTNKRILVILDDLWEELHFLKVGIPAAGERGGLKVLLTSRYKKVCSNMNAKLFEVKVLSEEESWYLFKETAEISKRANDLKNIPEEVAKECGGLPLAIVIVGKALKNQNYYAWKDALEELKEASVTSIPMYNLVNSRIKLSYKYLEDNSKRLLLLCSLFPEDYNIPLEDLVRYAKGLQSFKNAETVARARDKVYSITDDLKSCYLLLAGEEECVKLHDVVRDVCLSIVSSGEHLYMVRHAGLKEWPQEFSSASYTAISLSFDEIGRLPSGFECPELKLLRLILERSKLHIHEEFLEGMKKLKVLGLINMNGELPSSFRSLVSLRTLCLDNCRLYGHTSVIGSLKELEILSFYCSYLEHFPDNIAELRNLKSLDLRFKKGPPLPPDVLVSLKKLEELYLGSYFEEWERKGEEAYSGIIPEIGSLLNLQALRFCAYDDNCLERVLENLRPEKLIRYEITRTTDDIGVGQFQFRKVLMLQSINVDLLLNSAVIPLLGKTEDLTLSVEGLTNLVNQLDGEGFVNLKKLNLESCDLKYLIDATGILPSDTFVELERLVIRDANHLEELCHGDIPIGSFATLREVQLFQVPKLRHLWGSTQHPSLGNLRILEITEGGEVRSLFLQSSLKCLLQLQRINIEDCPKLETIVSNDQQNEETTGDIGFPKLEFVRLSSLDSFRSFGPESSHASLFEKVILANLETMDIYKMKGLSWIVDDQMQTGSLHKLRTITVEFCHGLKHVAASNSIKLLRSLERLDVILCNSLEVVFDFSGLNVEGTDIESPLGRLDSLKLWHLSNLKHIWQELPKGIHAFKNLRLLTVRRCHNLRYLLTPSMAEMLVGLESLELEWCKQMEEIIGGNERVIFEIETKTEEDIVRKKDGEESSNIIIKFPKLRRLLVDNLPNFRMLCSQNADLELPSLTDLLIRNCPEMTEFCVGRLSATRLNNVHIEKKIVAPHDFYSWLKDCESRTRCLNCSRFERESCDHLD